MTISLDTWKRAWAGVSVGLDLVRAIVDAAKRGEPERVDDILPDELRTTLEKRLADERARAKFAREKEFARGGLTGAGHP